VWGLESDEHYEAGRRRGSVGERLIDMSRAVFGEGGRGFRRWRRQ